MPGRRRYARSGRRAGAWRRRRLVAPSTCTPQLAAALSRKAPVGRAFVARRALSRPNRSRLPDFRGGCAWLGRPAGPRTPNPRPTRPPRAGRKTKCAKPGTASFGARPRRTRHAKNGCRFARVRRVCRPAPVDLPAPSFQRGASLLDTPRRNHIHFPARRDNPPHPAPPRVAKRAEAAPAPSGAPRCKENGRPEGTAIQRGQPCAT